MSNLYESPVVNDWLSSLIGSITGNPPPIQRVVTGIPPSASDAGAKLFDAIRRAQETMPIQRNNQ